MSAWLSLACQARAVWTGARSATTPDLPVTKGLAGACADVCSPAPGPPGVRGPPCRTPPPMRRSIRQPSADAQRPGRQEIGAAPRGRHAPPSMDAPHAKPCQDTGIPTGTLVRKVSLGGNRQAGRGKGYSSAVSRCLIWPLPADTGPEPRTRPLTPEVVRAHILCDVLTASDWLP